MLLIVGLLVDDCRRRAYSWSRAHQRKSTRQRQMEAKTSGNLQVKECMTNNMEKIVNGVS